MVSKLPGRSSRIRILTFYPFRIPDPGVKKAPDPGIKKAPDLGSATLLGSDEKGATPTVRYTVPENGGKFGHCGSLTEGGGQVRIRAGASALKRTLQAHMLRAHAKTENRE
jgi:hypothetical protein